MLVGVRTPPAEVRFPSLPKAWQFVFGNIKALLLFYAAHRVSGRQIIISAAIIFLYTHFRIAAAKRNIEQRAFAAIKLGSRSLPAKVGHLAK